MRPIKRKLRQLKFQVDQLFASHRQISYVTFSRLRCSFRVRATLVFLLPHSHADTPFIDPTLSPLSRSILPRALFPPFLSASPFFALFRQVPVVSVHLVPSSSLSASLFTTKLPRGKARTGSILRHPPPSQTPPPSQQPLLPLASINPTNQEARICPFELSGWLAALCCTRNFV